VLNKYVYPEWQDRPFRDIQRNDVNDLIDKIVDNHGARQADVVLAIVRKMMNWLTTRHHDYVSPVVRGMARTIPKERKRERFLDNDEIRALWTACADMGTFGALVKTLLLTAQREAKVADMKWDDVVDREWRIASEPREKANAKLLRLPQMALDIIAAQPRIAGNPYVFPAGRGSGRFNSFSQRKAELDEKLTTPSTFRTKPWVYHDLRRTSRKLMTRAGVRPDVGELALGHSIKGMQGVYDDITEYQPMIDDALQRVASEIDKIINPPPDNVVALRP
jgi:integrase